MGGSSTELSLVSITNGLFRIVDSLLVNNLGGDQFTDIIVDILQEEFQK